MRSQLGFIGNVIADGVHVGRIKIVFVAAFAVGYTSLSEEKADKMKKETKEASESAKDSKDALQDAKDYAFEQKAEFVAKMKSELVDVNKEIDKLLEKVEKSTGEVKTEAKAKLQALRDQATKLNKQLDEANNTAVTNWDDFKSGFRKSYADMKNSFKQSRQWMSEKIAP